LHAQIGGQVKVENGIRTVSVTRDADGKYKSVRIVFGPHYFVDVVDNGDTVKLFLGATHHGFVADASEVNGELERIIEETRRTHPNNVVD